jgi:hypothetical protein
MCRASALMVAFRLSHFVLSCLSAFPNGHGGQTQRFCSRNRGGLESLSPGNGTTLKAAHPLKHLAVLPAKPHCNQRRLGQHHIDQSISSYSLKLRLQPRNFKSVGPLSLPRLLNGLSSTQSTTSHNGPRPLPPGAICPSPCQPEARSVREALPAQTFSKPSKPRIQLVGKPSP